MLTLAAILMTTRQMTSYGEGLEGVRQDTTIHRDHGSTERKLGTGPSSVGGESRFTTDTARGPASQTARPEMTGDEGGLVRQEES
jgi:hypothetical protein